MSPHNPDSTMAVFLDLENIALGAHDAHYPPFNIQKVLERLLLKGHIVVKKAYCDFDRYRGFKRDLHEAAFELIEIPHVRQSGKNSADIRMVVDALDLCYTKGHVDTFVIISGDSDFSPLVSKLRENAKTVIGVGVKNSTSDLFINNCDTFIYYDDLVRTEVARVRPMPVIVPPSAVPGTVAGGAPANAAASAAPRPADVASKSSLTAEKAVVMVTETLRAIDEETGEDERIWGSMIKQAIKRRNPGFNERAHGFRSFNDLLIEAQRRGILKLQADEKSGGYLVELVDAGLPPVEVKSFVAAKPVTEGRPVAEVKPVTDLKPVVEVKPAAEVKPVAESKPVTTVKPTVPAGASVGAGAPANPSGTASGAVAAVVPAKAATIPAAAATATVVKPRVEAAKPAAAVLPPWSRFN